MANTPIQADWKSIQIAVCSGMEYKEASEAFGVPYEALKKRAKREQWPTKHAINAKMKELQAVQGNNGIVPFVPEAVLQAKMAESWLKKAENHRALAFDMATTALKSAKPDRLSAWQDIERADKMARRASGLDSTEGNTAVNVNLALVNQRILACPLPPDAIDV